VNEIQFYLVNGLIGALSLMAFHVFRSWYYAVEHQYKMYSLRSEAERTRDELRSLVNSVSRYEIECLQKTIKEFGTTVDLHHAITWFREQRGNDQKKIRELEDKVNFLWRNKDAP